MNSFYILYGFTRTYCEITHKPISADDVRNELLSMIPDFTDFKQFGFIFGQLVKDGVISQRGIKKSNIPSAKGRYILTYLSITYRKRQQQNRKLKQIELFTN